MESNAITYEDFVELCKDLGVAVPCEQWYKDNIEKNYGG